MDSLSDCRQSNFEAAEGLGKQTVHYFATQSRLRLPPLLER